MHQYTCPKCKTVLKREQPVSEGKKIKCPKCENIFAPSAAITAKAGGKSGKSKDEDDDRNPYAVVKEEKEEEKMKEAKQRAAMGLVADRFEKSARGPAISVIVRPASYLIGAGILTCALSMAALFIGIWPLVFAEFYKEGPNNPKLSAREKAAQGEADFEAIQTRSIIFIAVSPFTFAFGALVCVGALKLRAIESYPWAMVGAVMALIAAPGNGGAVFWLFYYLAKVFFVDTMGFDTGFAMMIAALPAGLAVVFTLVSGIWAIVAMTNEKVKEAFEEEKEGDIF
jgi:uncharacterized Zn finger protein (UPF0148 family)